MSYTAIADKLDQEYDILWSMLEREDNSFHHYVLLVQQAKRVRTQGNLLVRALAAHRDHLQPTGHKENNQQ